MSGMLCLCSVCGREERAGESPLRNGWPMCHGYTMTLIDTQAFIDSLDDEVDAAFGPVHKRLNAEAASLEDAQTSTGDV